MQKSVLMIVALLASLTLAAPAWAGCFGETTINSYQVETTPTTDCLDVTVTGDQCGGDVIIALENTCAASFTPDSDQWWRCEQDADCDYAEDGNRVTAIKSGGTATLIISEYAADTDETRNFTGTLDGEAVDIEVQFNATEVDTSDEGCSQTGTKPSASWLAAALGLLALGASRRRRIA